MKRTALLTVLAFLVVSAAAQEGDQTTAMSSDKPTNQVVDNPQEAAESVVRILRTSNKAQTNKFVCEALEFKNANPYDLVNFFWAVTSREEGGVYSFVAPDEKSGYLVVICPEYQLPTLRRLAKELDRPKLNSAPGSKYVYYRLRHRNVTDPGFLDVASFYLGSSGVLIPDVETNSVLIFDAPEGATAMEQTFREFLDKPLTPVEVQVKIFEVTVNSDGTLGLDFEAWKNGPGRHLAYIASLNEYLDHEGRSDNRFKSRHLNSRGLFLHYPSQFFDFLVEKGKASVVTDTRLTVVHRSPAMLTTGEQILYYEVTDRDGWNRELTGRLAALTKDGLVFPTDGRVVTAHTMREPFAHDGIPLAQFPNNEQEIASEVRAVDTGVYFTVVPTVGQKSIDMELDLRVVNNLGFDGEGQPVLSSRQVRDELSVENGQTVMFGGLVREREIETTRKIPILGSLPVLGFLFGGEISTNRKSFVVAAVTPRLLTEGDNMTEQDVLIREKATGGAPVNLTEFP